MNKRLSIFVAGHAGMVGRHVVEALKDNGYENVMVCERKKLNLCDQNQVFEYFKINKPQAVIMAAAKVGGIGANSLFRSDFIYENLQMQNNIIWASYQSQVKHFVFLGSSCIYPKEADQPMKETSLLTGPLEYTNRPYAIAKIAGLELIDALRKQHHLPYFSVMPSNLYGPFDNFHLQNAHVLPALIHRFVLAKEKNLPNVTVWGSGRPLREFMHVEDCARAIVFLFEHLKEEHFKDSPMVKGNWSHINVGSAQEISIHDLAYKIKSMVGYDGKIDFDQTKPDGTMKKLLDSSYLQSLGFNLKWSLDSGIENTVKWFLENRNHFREK